MPTSYTPLSINLYLIHEAVIEKLLRFIKKKTTKILILNISKNHEPIILLKKHIR